MSHTPGPWEILKSGFIITHSRPERKAIGQFTGCCSEQKHVDEHPYNNALIAAAPELYEALKAMLEEDDGGHAANQARAAIKKAEGK